jgi:hypothetical protein
MEWAHFALSFVRRTGLWEDRMFGRSIVLMAMLVTASAGAQAAPAKLDFPLGEAPTGTKANAGSAKSATTTTTTATATTAAAPGTAPSDATSTTPAVAASPEQPAAISDTAPYPIAPINDNAIDNTIGTSQFHELSDDPLFLPAALTIGGGSAVLLASLFTGLSAHGTYTRLEKDCKSDLCPNGSQSRIDSGKTLAVLSTVLTGVGIVAVGVGVALLIVANKRSGLEAPATASLRLSPGPTPLSLGATATF